MRNKRHEPFDFLSLWHQIEADVLRCAEDNHEFPLTQMTKAVAQEIARTPFPQAHSRALDVGTGTGVHALFMSKLGFAVTAIDSSCAAVEHAGKRIQRMTGTRPGRPGSGVRVKNVQIDHYASTKPFQVITFNPPAYYDVRGRANDSPAASGVFVDDNEHEKTDRAPLFRFFKSVVLPYLAPGGRVICSWPSIERRVVVDTATNSVVSPFTQLRRWFGIEVLDEEPWQDFYSCEADLRGADYGLHDSFWENVVAARDLGLFSPLVDATQAEQHVLRFRFGILNMARSTDDPNLFRRA